MRFLICIVTIYILLNSIGYAVYELKKRNNKVGGITTIMFGIAQCIFTNIIVFVLNR